MPKKTDENKSSTLSLSGSDEKSRWPNHGEWPTTPELRFEDLEYRTDAYFDQKKKELSIEGVCKGWSYPFCSNPCLKDVLILLSFVLSF
jgi:hypothetical protein